MINLKTNLKIINQIALRLLQLYSSRAYYKFIKATSDPVAAQNLIFSKIIKNLIKSDYGKFHNITTNTNYEQFKNQIPINNYENLKPWIIESQNKENTLTHDRIDFYEYTSGSTSVKKIIPYNKQLRTSFANMFKIWCYDLLKNNLKLKSGKIFISISPPIKTDMNLYHNKQIKIDSDYLSGITKYLTKKFILTNSNIFNKNNSDDFILTVSILLLGSEDLEIISIWSPSYLIIILNYISNNITEIINNINFDPKIPNSRKKYLNKILNYNLTTKRGINWETIWPNLKFISCWDSASAKYSADKLKKLFPNVLIQGKGLLATEAPITVPIIKSNNFVPLINQIFFEFENDNGKILRLHQLEINKTYEIVISQLAGLYRYKLGDYIKVTNYFNNTPNLEFIGRTKNTVDLVGEKLNEQFVANILTNQPFDNTGYLLLIPELLSSGQGRYILLSDNINLNNSEYINILDSKLRQSFHYNNARNLFQLLEPEIIYNSNMRELITNVLIKQGIKLGDQKESYLIVCLKKSKAIGNSIKSSRTANLNMA